MSYDMITQLQHILDTRFGGLLKRGLHPEQNECCALELISVARQIAWTDGRGTRCWDLRPLNDIDVSDSIRTKYMLPVIAAYDGSRDWPPDRQCAVATRLAILTVNRIVACLPGLDSSVVAQCASASDLDSARAAARAAARVAESAVEWAARTVRAARASAVSAQSAAEWVSAESMAEWAPRAAARAAESAAELAGWTAEMEASTQAKQNVFIMACQIWLEAVGYEQPES